MDVNVGGEEVLPRTFCPVYLRWGRGPLAPKCACVEKICIRPMILRDDGMRPRWRRAEGKTLHLFWKTADDRYRRVVVVVVVVVMGCPVRSDVLCVHDWMYG